MNGHLTILANYVLWLQKKEDYHEKKITQDYKKLGTTIFSELFDTRFKND
jgi:hypothetical protein